MAPTRSLGAVEKRLVARKAGVTRRARLVADHAVRMRLECVMRGHVVQQAPSGKAKTSSSTAEANSPAGTANHVVGAGLRNRDGARNRTALVASAMGTPSARRW